MIIITGGAGFIGSNLVAKLEEITDEDIVISDRLRNGMKWRNIAHHNMYDIIHPDNLFQFLEKHIHYISIIFHMGAISSTTEQDVDLILNNNSKLTMKLMNWCVTYNKRFIYASSAATYGNGSHDFIDNTNEIELKKLIPLNAYGWSKHWVDRRIIKMRDNNLDLPPQWVGLKFFNVYGPNEYHKGAQQSVISHIYNTISKGNQAKLFKSYRLDYKDGEQKRDFIFVDDCINVMLWFFKNKDISGIYNVGTGKARTFIDLALSVYKSLNKRPNIEFIDMPIELKKKYQYFTKASITKLRNIGYQEPFTSLEEGIRKYVQYYLINENPYR